MEKSDKTRREKMQKVGQSRNIVFLTCFVDPESGGSKSRLANVAGAKPAGQMKHEKLYAVVVRSTFGSKKWQSTPSRSTLGS